ncbi:MAG: dihydroorotate dehydrogenase-like protein [Lentisphaeria bacterium]|nr:dihydroorotate dehydrogenase-like protein [Lentisphaeria bacterium]
MADLSTSYLGLALKNPVIVGASPLTATVDALRRCEDAGAGAVVMKSLFEEQIRAETTGLRQELENELHWHAEVFAYMEADLGMRYGPREYLQIVSEAKKHLSIPIIASINCTTPENWADFAAEVEGSGADALELNIAIMPTAFDRTAEEVESEFVRIVETARETVGLPISVKLPQHFSALPHLVLRLARAGANGLVLFNRLYQPTIDPETVTVTIGERRSASAEISTALRWTALLADRVNLDIATNTGVHTGADVARCILAGADAVQIVSAVLASGHQVIGEMTQYLDEWMERMNYETISDARGLLSQAQKPDEDLFGRCQYIKGIVGAD